MERPDKQRRRTSHSLEAVLDNAVAILDEAGDSALTFRALAARLGGGVASIYWYVSSRDELLDRATDHVIGQVISVMETRPAGDDPIENLRDMAVTLFECIVDRQWLATYFMRNTTIQNNSLALYERFGQQTLPLNLTPLQRFHAVSAVVGVVIGTAADLGQGPPTEVLSGAYTPEEWMRRFSDSWRALDPADFPFIHDIVDEFAGHDDVVQFKAALDLTLQGLRLLAGLPHRPEPKATPA